MAGSLVCKWGWQVVRRPSWRRRYFLPAPADVLLCIGARARAEMKRSQPTIYAVMLHLMQGAHQASPICLFSGCAVCSAVCHCIVSDTVLDCYSLNKLGIKLWVAFKCCHVIWGISLLCAGVNAITGCSARPPTFSKHQIPM